MTEQARFHFPTEKHIGKLFGQYERVNQPKKAEALADEIVREGLENSYDVLSAFTVIHRGMELLHDPAKRDKGKAILQRTEQYFTEQQLVYKFLIPLRPNRPTTQQIQSEYVLTSTTGLHIVNLTQQANNQRLIDPVGIRMEKDSPLLRIHATYAFIKQAVEMLKQLNNTDARGSMIDYSVPNRLDETDAYIQKKHMYNSIAAVIMDPARAGSETGYLLPEDVSALLEDASSIAIDGLPDLYTHQCGPTSLKNLAEYTGDSETFNKNVLTYIAAMPKGNLLWQIVANSVFLSQPLGIYRLEKDFFKNPQFSSNIMQFRLWLANKFFEPALGEKPDREFDTLFMAMAENLGSIAIANLASSLGFNAVHGAKLYGMINPETTYDEAVENAALVYTAYHEFRKDHPHEFARVDRISHTFFNQKWHHIDGLLRQRFYQYQNIHYLTNLIRVAIPTSEIHDSAYAQEELKNLRNVLHQNLGDTFIQELPLQAESREKEAQKRIEALQAQLQGKKWVQATEGKIKTISDVRLKRLGVQSIRYRTINGTLFVVIPMRGEKVQFDMTATIDKNLHISDTPITLDESHEFSAFLTNVILSAVQILVRDKSLLTSAENSSRKPRTKPEDSDTINANLRKIAEALEREGYE